MNKDEIGSRYSDAYLVARTVNGVGQTIKKVGLIGGAITVGLSVLLSVMLVKDARGSDVAGIAASIVFYMGSATGVIVGTILYILGVLVASQGQILKATLDGSVNTSPFLTDDQRLQIMSSGASRIAPAGTTGRRNAGNSTDWQCECGQTNYQEKASCVRCGKAATATT